MRTSLLTGAQTEQPVAAYRAALEEHTRDRVPLQWALTQTNLGSALQSLGERKRKPCLFKDALEATKAAREVYRDAGMVQSEAYFANRIKALEAKVGR
jgi:hypothetical protein